MKRTWDDSYYDQYQMTRINLGRGNDPAYGNIDDLDPRKYNWSQMTRISKGRGDNDDYQNLDRLDPKIHKDFYELNKDILNATNPEYFI